MPEVLVSLFPRALLARPDLFGVAVRVGGVDLEPAFDGVAAAFGVACPRAATRPRSCTSRISAVVRRAALNASSDASIGRS